MYLCKSNYESLKVNSPVGFLMAKCFIVLSLFLRLFRVARALKWQKRIKFKLLWWKQVEQSGDLLSPSVHSRRRFDKEREARAIKESIFLIYKNFYLTWNCLIKSAHVETKRRAKGRRITVENLFVRLMDSMRFLMGAFRHHEWMKWSYLNDFRSLNCVTLSNFKVLDLWTWPYVGRSCLSLKVCLEGYLEVVHWHFSPDGLSLQTLLKTEYLSVYFRLLHHHFHHLTP
jgi:hypothetical protein